MGTSWGSEWRELAVFGGRRSAFARVLVVSNVLHKCLNIGLFLAWRSSRFALELSKEKIIPSVSGRKNGCMQSGCATPGI
jgi:hypothetical protein